MKKVLSLLLATMLVMALFTGCGQDAAKKPGEETTNGDTENSGEENKDATASDAEQVLKNVNARKAIAMAFDKEFITNELLGGASQPVNFFVPVGLAVDEQGNDFRAEYPDGWNGYDPAKASEYWAQAKEEVGFDTVEIELLNYDTENSKKIGEHIKSQLETNLEGLTLTINQQPFENKLDLSKKGEYNINFAAWGPDYPDPMTFMEMWVTGGGFNEIGFSNAEYDKLINDSKSGELATDVAGRWKAMQEAERILLEDNAALAPIYQRARPMVRKSYIDGIYYHTFGGDFTYKRATTTKEESNGILYLTDKSDIPSMNSTVSTDTVSLEAFANTFEGLVMLGENDVIEPGVAESWDVSEDGLTYTFHLRDNAVWSNGEKVKADDFIYAIRKLVTTPEAQYAFMAETAGIKNAAKVKSGELEATELGVSAPDENTVVFELDLAVPYFIKLLTFPAFYPQNQVFVEAQGDAYGTSIDTTLYNGAFVLSAWEIGYEYAFTKNEKYWDAANTTCEGVNRRIIKDVNADVNLYETGETDQILSLDTDNLPNYLDSTELFILEESVVFYLMFNQGFEGLESGQESEH